MAMNNIFLGGSDPLLGNVPSYQRGSVEDELARIAAALQVSSDYLIGLTEAETEF